MFGEPETGGEAYIPLGAQKRARSTELLHDVAGRFGYGLIPMAAGGVLAPAPPAVAAGPIIGAGAFLAALAGMMDKAYSTSARFGPNTFDCSGLIHAALARVGINDQGAAGFTSLSYEDWTMAAGTHLSAQQALGIPGALLFLGHTTGPTGHIGVSTGTGNVYETPSSTGASGVDAFGYNRWTAGGTVPGMATARGGAGSGVPPIPVFGKGAPAAMATAAAKKMNDAMTAKMTAISSSLSFAMPGASGGPMNAPGNLKSWIDQAIQITGVGMDWESDLIKIAMRESGGDPNAVNNWDSNAKAGHPSKGLMQTIDSTFASNMLPGHGDIWNPVDNAIAAIRYIEGRYGGNHAPVAGPGGYAEGGIIADSGTVLRPGANLLINRTGADEALLRRETIAAALGTTPGAAPGPTAAGPTGIGAPTPPTVKATSDQIGVVWNQGLDGLVKTTDEQLGKVNTTAKTRFDQTSTLVDESMKKVGVTMQKGAAAAGQQFVDAHQEGGAAAHHAGCVFDEHPHRCPRVLTMIGAPVTFAAGGVEIIQRTSRLGCDCSVSPRPVVRHTFRSAPRSEPGPSSCSCRSPRSSVWPRWPRAVPCRRSRCRGSRHSVLGCRRRWLTRSRRRWQPGSKRGSTRWSPADSGTVLRPGVNLLVNRTGADEALLRRETIAAAAGGSRYGSGNERIVSVVTHQHFEAPVYGEDALRQATQQQLDAHDEALAQRLRVA